jgi:hypothetical protein
MSPLPYPRFFWLPDGDLVFRRRDPDADLEAWNFYEGHWQPATGVGTPSQQDLDYMRMISPAQARQRIAGEYQPPTSGSNSGRLADAIPKDAPVTPEHDQMTPAQAANNRIAARRYALMLDGEDPDDPANW